MTDRLREAAQAVVALWDSDGLEPGEGFYQEAMDRMTALADALNEPAPAPAPSPDGPHFKTTAEQSWIDGYNEGYAIGERGPWIQRNEYLKMEYEARIRGEMLDQVWPGWRKGEPAPALDMPEAILEGFDSFIRKPAPSGGVNYFITSCIHGVDLRFTPRCYLCRPVPDEPARADTDALREAMRRMAYAAKQATEWVDPDRILAVLDAQPAPALDVEAHPFTLEMFDALQEVLAAHIYETSGDQGDRYFCRMCDAEVTTNDPHADGCEYMLLRRWTLDVAHARAVAAYTRGVTRD